MSLRVLVFDGDPPLASALEQALVRVGCDVICQGERSSFMAAAIAKTPDLIVFVYQPSRTEAFSVCLAVRRDPSLGKVPTALVSRHAVEGEFEKHKGTKNHADAYFASVASGEQLLVRLHDVLPSLPVAPGSGPGIDIVEEGFDDDDDADARTVVGRIPMDLFAAKGPAKEPSADSSDRPTIGSDDAVIDIADPLVVDEAHIAFGTMPDSSELVAEAPRLPSVPPPVPASEAPVPEAPASTVVPSAARRDAEAKAERLEAAVADRDATIAALRADVDARERDVSELRATVTDTGRQLEELKAKLTAASKGQGNVSMKEFLDLREQIGKRDRELLQVREELTRKERELIDERDRSLVLERARAEADETLTELTRAKVDAEEARAKFEADATHHAERAKAAEAAAEEHLGSVARERDRAGKASEELEALRGEHARLGEALMAAKAEASAAIEAARSEAASALEAAKSEAAGALAAANARAEEATAATKAAETLAEERLLELRNIGAQKAAAEVELERLREEQTGLVEAQEHDRRALADLRVASDAERAAHEAAMAAARAESGATIEALERDRDGVRVAEAQLRSERDELARQARDLEGKVAASEAAVAETRASLASAEEGAARAKAEASASLEAAERAAAEAASSAAAALAAMTAKHGEAYARALALEAEADGIRAERDALQRTLDDLRAAQARAAAERHAALERARDALAVALAEVDALPLGDAT
jgi:chromosome segregation ATPase